MKLPEAEDLREKRRRRDGRFWEIENLGEETKGCMIKERERSGEREMEKDEKHKEREDSAMVESIENEILVQRKWSNGRNLKRGEESEEGKWAPTEGRRKMRNFEGHKGHVSKANSGKWGRHWHPSSTGISLLHVLESCAPYPFKKILLNIFLGED